MYPGRAQELCALSHSSPFQLLVATILSAQCTDTRVNMVAPEVFRRWPEPADLAHADLGELEQVIHSTGFFRAKASHLTAMARRIQESYDGEVPARMEDLTTLAGVGRKTANVIRSVGFDQPGLPVDTHVGRVSLRLALTDRTDPVQVERDLNKLITPKERGVFSLRVILHGRATCRARRPLCRRCPLVDICPSAGPPAGEGGPSGPG
jgi:endonuclease-3